MGAVISCNKNYTTDPDHYNDATNKASAQPAANSPSKKPGINSQITHISRIPKVKPIPQKPIPIKPSPGKPTPEIKLSPEIKPISEIQAIAERIVTLMIKAGLNIEDLIKKSALEKSIIEEKNRTRAKILERISKTEDYIELNERNYLTFQLEIQSLEREAEDLFDSLNVYKP